MKKNNKYTSRHFKLVVVFVDIFTGQIHSENGNQVQSIIHQTKG